MEILPLKSYKSKKFSNKTKIGKAFIILKLRVNKQNTSNINSISNDICDNIEVNILAKLFL